MTTTAQHFESFQGVDQTVTWTLSGVDESAETPTFAARETGGDVTVTGTAALSGSDTVCTVTIPQATADALEPGVRAYQLHLGGEVVATGRWTLTDSYAD